MANNLGLLMGSYNQARTDSAPPGRTAPVAHLGLTYGDANRGPWYPSERERERVQKLAERDRKKRERRQELRDAPGPWESIRGFLEPETGAGMGALLGTSMLPVAGEAIDIADIAAGIQDRDPWRIGFGGLGLLMPFVAGSTLRKLAQRGVAQGAADMTRKELQSLLSAKGLPATGTTETLRELATVVGKNPEDWTRSEFDLARPHILVHQDFRSGNDPAKILKEGLTRGQVDRLSGLDPGADRHTWSWGGKFQGTPGGAYLMWPGDINYSSGTSPWMRSGKPFMHISPAKGDDPFTAITGSRRAADEVAEAAPEAPNVITNPALFDVSREALDPVPTFRAQEPIPYAQPTARANIDEVRALNRSQKSTRELMEAAERGIERGGLGWYNASQLRDIFIDVLGAGEEVGDEAFQLAMDQVAAYSPRSKVPINIARASRARAGIPEPWEKGYGHLAQGLHRKIFGDLMNTGSLESLTAPGRARPKIRSFGANLGGNYRPLTADVHYGTAAGLGRAPEPLEYGTMADRGSVLAGRLGIPEAPFQSSTWVGYGGVDDYSPFLKLVEDAAEISAGPGGDKLKALKAWIRGEAGLGSFAPLALGGAAGAAARSQRERNGDQ